MKLHSAPFESALKRLIKTAIRQSPELKREAKRGRFRRQFRGILFFRILGSALLGMVVATTFDHTNGTGAPLAVMTMWTALTACFRATFLLGNLAGSPDSAALANLPVSDAFAFRWEWLRFIVGSGYSFCDVLTGLVVLAVLAGFSWVSWFFLIPVAFIAGLTHTAFAVFLATQLPRIAQVVAGSSMALWIVGLVLGRFVPWPKVGEFLDKNAVWVNSLLPTGWALSLFQLIRSKPEWWVLVFFAPIAFLLLSLKRAFKGLEANYVFREMELPESPDLIPGGGPDSEEPVTGAPSERHLGTTEIEQIVSSRRFLQTPHWHSRGRLENRLWKWFTPRERVLVDFAFEDGLDFSRSWKKIFRNLLIGGAAGSLLRLIHPPTGLILIATTTFVTTIQVLYHLFGTGAAFSKVFCSGVNMPLYAGFPIGFREFSRVIFKRAAVQLALIIPFAMVTAVLIVRSFEVSGISLIESMAFGLKAGFLLAAATFGAVTFGFSSGTNDTSRLRIGSLVLLSAVALLTILFVVFGCAALFIPHAVVSWSFLLVAILDCYAFFRIYGWFFHRNCFDLMSVPRQ